MPDSEMEGLAYEFWVKNEFGNECPTILTITLLFLQPTFRHVP